MNVVKIGGQSIMDRGRSAVGPVVDEIVANLTRHKMILGTGAGTRARHVYSLAIDLGLPVGVLTVLGTAVAWQNAQMLQYLLARHGIAFLEPEGFASLPHYLMERGAVICQGMPPYKLWEANPERRPHPAAAHRHRLLPDRRGVRRPQDDLRQGRGRALHRRPEEGPEARRTSRASACRSCWRATSNDLVVERAVLELMLNARHIREIQFVNGLKPGQLTAALDGEPVGTIIFNAAARRPPHERQAG